MLTPLAVDQGHPFPHLLNKSLNLAVLLQRPNSPEKLFAVVQVPAVLPRFVPLPADKGSVFTTLETVIRLHLHELFPGMQLERAFVFRVTRNSEYEIDDDDVEDLLKTIEEEVRKRRHGFAVRLEIEADAPSEVSGFLIHALDLDSIDVYPIADLLDLTALFQIHGLPGFSQLRDPQFVPQPVAEFANAPSTFAAIRAHDILMHHPYESFGPVVDFIETAANDERVLAIKQTLYRTSSDSPVVRALAQAADNGKQVTAVIELKARLDEERNILWARELEKSGVHVVFGFIGLKTHCKVALVVRREDEGIRRYVHLATGNYNPQTARLYTDLSYFTCNSEFCEDASALFNYLTGYCELPQWRKLIVAPSRMQNFMLEKIHQESVNQQTGKNGRIIAKINGLLEPVIVQALYRASQAGVKIDLICRGICACVRSYRASAKIFTSIPSSTGSSSIAGSFISTTAAIPRFISARRTGWTVTSAAVSRSFSRSRHRSSSSDSSMRSWPFPWRTIPRCVSCFQTAATAASNARGTNRSCAARNASSKLPPRTP